jgi:hypothetical protein
MRAKVSAKKTEAVARASSLCDAKETHGLEARATTGIFCLSLGKSGL